MKFTDRSYPPKPADKEGYNLELQRKSALKDTGYYWEYIPRHKCPEFTEDYDPVVFGRWGWQTATADPQESMTGLRFCMFCGEKLDPTVKRLRA